MIIINKIKNSKKINKELLKLIEEIKNPYVDELGNNVSNTDWSLPKDYKRKYLDYFIEIIKPYLYKINKKLNSKEFIIHNFWFQQYLKLDKHSWHTHEGANFTNIYFVELPDNSLTTEIFKYKKIKLNEGDLLTFPAYYFHRSPINNTNKRKTIISFNSSINGFIK
jgi:hypothetical protein